MEIHVKLLGQLRRYARDGRYAFPMQLPPKTLVSGLLEQLGIPPAAHQTILLNGRRADEQTLLLPGDEIVLMPPIEGG